MYVFDVTLQSPLRYLAYRVHVIASMLRQATRTAEDIVVDIKISDLTLKYDEFVAVDNVSLEIPDGESLVLLGESGCGKTSTMRCIGGLETPYAGNIRIGDNRVFDSTRRRNVPPNRRNVGMVFQSYAIWPDRSVRANVAFGLKSKKVPKDELERKVDQALSLIGLDHLADRGASALSGGQMQRVALARSIAMEPAVLLLDEPLSNLDAQLRVRLRNELRRIQLESGLTSVYVTHDQSEAMALADKIAIMKRGSIVQLGTPPEIYDRPANSYIARFLGMGNVLDITRNGDGSLLLEGTPVPAGNSPAAWGPGNALCIRPEQVVLTAPGAAQDVEGAVLSGQVTSSIFQGSDVSYEIDCGGLTIQAVATRAHYGGRSVEAAIGDKVDAVLAADKAIIVPLDEETN